MITWKEEYSVGVKEIDEQHKYFVGLLNDLCSMLGREVDNEKIGKILADLVEYKEVHFATEEKYFDQFGYENTAEHKDEHQQLRDKVKKFQERYADEGADIIVDFVDFMEDWLVDHLSNQDMKYKKCFNDHGLF